VNLKFYKLSVVACCLLEHAFSRGGVALRAAQSAGTRDGMTRSVYRSCTLPTTSRLTPPKSQHLTLSLFLGHSVVRRQ